MSSDTPEIDTSGGASPPVRPHVRNYIEDNFLYMHPDLELADDDELLARGVIDSLGFLELVEEIQETFAITVGDIEITEANLGSVNAIVAFVERKRSE